MIQTSKQRSFNFFLIFLFIQWFFIPAVILAETEIVVYIGHSEVMDFDMAVKRVSIANPDIADATVISLNQILLNGTEAGRTTLIVWEENDIYTKYTVHVMRRASRQQVMLEVKFMEVNKAALKEFGSDFIVKNIKAGGGIVDLGGFSTKVSEPSDPLALGNTVDFFLNIPTLDFESIYKALQENNVVTLLANPNICAADGTQASFLAGGEFPIPVVSGSSGMQTVTIQFKEYGMKLGFRPNVLDSSLIFLEMEAEVSNLDFENGVALSGFEIPSLSTRKTTTSVEIREGEYLVIGGLMSNKTAKSVSKIPVLGSIPVLGALFSSKKFQNDESELIIALSPKIISTVNEKDVPNPVEKYRSSQEKKNKSKEENSQTEHAGEVMRNR